VKSLMQAQIPEDTAAGSRCSPQEFCSEPHNRLALASDRADFRHYTFRPIYRPTDSEYLARRNNDRIEFCEGGLKAAWVLRRAQLARHPSNELRTPNQLPEGRVVPPRR